MNLIQLNIVLNEDANWANCITHHFTYQNADFAFRVSFNVVHIKISSCNFRLECQRENYVR